MASRPTYNPNLVESNFGRINNIRAACRPAAPLLNRATDGLYTPGSTFKVVTTRGRARLGQVHDRLALRRPGLLHRVRQAGAQLRRPERARDVRLGRLPAGAPALDQLRLLRDRQGDRRGPRSSAPRSSSASTRTRRSRRRATSARRAASTRTAGSSTRATRRRRSTRAGSRSARSGCSRRREQMAMVAAAVAQQGRDHAAARRRPDRLARRAGSSPAPSRASTSAR